jgi:hypothetical protein
MANQLTEFLEDRKGKAHGVDWHAKKEEWIAALLRLHDKIGQLLEPSVSKGVATKMTTWIEITEDFIGTYSAPELRLVVGDDRVVFSPKALNVYGAAGRVDVKGDRDVIALIRLPAEASGEWQFVLQRVPKLVTAPLDERSLVNALEHVMAP